MYFFELFWICSCYLTFSVGYNILAIVPYHGYSHVKFFDPIISELVSRGHNLTVLLHRCLNIESQNYKELLLSYDSHVGTHLFDVETFDWPSWMVVWAGPSFLIAYGISSCQHLLSNSEVQKLMDSSDHFDLILSELFDSECNLGFKFKFKAPLVGLSSNTLMAWYTDRFGQPDNPSYIPNGHLSYSAKMNFFERLGNVLGDIMLKANYYFATQKIQLISEKYFKTKMPSFFDMAKNTSLVLVNSYWALHFPRPNVPAVIEIGGSHILPSKALPKNIEKFINESTHGVIYFSLGSMIKGHTFPQEKKEEFLRAFARLPQRVLWKWENETMPGKPDNVMIQKWMPQFDILSHPNVKAFISHGGLLGVTEAVHCGVPMIVMPQYGDQHTNAKAVEANGGGVILYLREATEEKVYQNLKTILDPEFRSKAKALSERFRDRPMSPMDTAIYWIEYVARHKGAPHMRTAAVDMPLYQYLLLDVFAFLAVVLIIFLYISYKISSLILRAIFSKKKLKQN